MQTAKIGSDGKYRKFTPTGHRCHDCRKPSSTYRCPECKAKWLAKWQAEGNDYAPEAVDLGCAVALP